LPASADTCIDRSVAVAKDDAARKAGEAAYQKALAAKKLKPVALSTIGLDNGDRNYLPGDYKSFVVKDVDSNLGKMKVLTDIQGSCGGPAAELVQQGTKIFRVERKPKLHPKKFETCQCTYLMRGGCGIAASVRAVGHVLPAGTTYAGTVTIEYDEDTIEVTHVGACEPPAPPP
jgi:hypothetical protein